ncbi:MAG: MlaA family lipoprotein [Candidatus Gracilibacteria bacterium]
MKNYYYLVFALLVLFLGSGCARQENILSSAASINMSDNVGVNFQKDDEPGLEDSIFGDDDFDTEDEYTILVYDPLEPSNRWVFKGNHQLYKKLLIPGNDFYKFVAHEYVQKGVSNFYHNIGAPGRIIGNILLLRLGDAGLEFVGFIVNSITSLGICDIFPYDDHIKSIGISDVLKEYGVPEGLYVVWPVIGPSTVRKTLGTAGDVLLSLPAYLLSGPAALALGVTKIVTQTNFENYLDGYKFSLDPYVGFRTEAFDY